MVGDGERLEVACDPLTIPLRAATLLNTPLMYQTFPYACLAHIPKSAQPFIGLGLLLGTTRSITPAADMKAMTRPLPRFRTFGLLASMSIPLSLPSINDGAPKKCSERCRKYCKNAQKSGNAPVRVSGVHAGHGVVDRCFMTVGV